MNELLAWYGYDKVDSTDTGTLHLNLQEFDAAKRGPLLNKALELQVCFMNSDNTSDKKYNYPLSPMYLWAFNWNFLKIRGSAFAQNIET